MSNIQLIQNRIASKQNKITSLANQITSLQEEISQYQVQLLTELDNRRTIQSKTAPLIDFLHKWKLNSYEHYNSKLKAYFQDVQHIHDLTDTLNELKVCNVNYVDYLQVRNLEEELSDAQSALSEALSFGGKYFCPSIQFIFEYSTYEEAVSFFIKWLDKTTGKLYDNAIKRIQGKVGEIVDASSIELLDHGWIHGEVIGVNGIVLVRGYGSDQGRYLPKIWSKLQK